MSTTTVPDTLQRVLDRANPNELPSALAKTKPGHTAAIVNVVTAGLTLAAAFDITTAAFKALSTITGIDLDTGEGLPPIGTLLQCEIITSGGTSDTGPRVLGLTAAAKGAGSVGICSLSSDGKTITFEGTCTAITFAYVPRSALAVTTLYPT